MLSRVGLGLGVVRYTVLKIIMIEIGHNSHASHVMRPSCTFIMCMTCYCTRCCMLLKGGLKLPRDSSLLNGSKIL